MCDLDALSREIAATSDAWIMPGVSCVDPVCGWRFRAVTSGANLDWVYEGIREASLDRAGVFRVKSALLAGPNLRDPVTVNSLLGDGGNVQRVGNGGWVATVAPGDFYWGATRTEAIARAWIAAHKGSK